LTAEDGSTTADWIVLTAGVVGLGLGSVAAVRGGTRSLAGDISTSLTQSSVVSLGTLNEVVRYVTSSGRGYAVRTDATCEKGVCTQGYDLVYMWYQLDDGSWAAMTEYTYDDGTVNTTWTDASGDEITAPRFPD
jgi:hypothetical protein